MKIESTKGIGFYPCLETSIIISDNELVDFVNMLQNVINDEAPTPKDMQIAQAFITNIIKSSTN